MIFVDSNIPMYLVGAPHPNKDTARLVLERAIVRHERLVTSAEVLQEILHRYHGIRRLDAVQPAFDALLGVVDEVFSITESNVRDAKDMLLGRAPVSARDALHLAVMKGHGITRIMSYDTELDAVEWVERVY